MAPTKAYIIIDLQNDYFPGGKFELKNIEHASSNAAKFLQFARTKPEELLVIHVRHVFAPSEPAPFFEEGTEGSQIHDVVKPLAGETVITKHQPNSFIGTPLQELLTTNGIKELYVSGAMTNICVQGTVRAASELGYKVELLTDAVTTKDWEYDGKTVTYDQVNTAIFATLAFGYADLVTTSEALSKLQ